MISFYLNKTTLSLVTLPKQSLGCATLFSSIPWRLVSPAVMDHDWIASPQVLTQRRRIMSASLAALRRGSLAAAAGSLLVQPGGVHSAPLGRVGTKVSQREASHQEMKSWKERSGIECHGSLKRKRKT